MSGSTKAQTSLSSSEMTRYSRHILLPEVGIEGQQKLKAARVLIIGAGGLGCPAAIYLAAAGVGTIGIVDFDVVDLSNLQRQILHSTANVGTSKCISAKQRLLETNPEVSVVVHEEKFDAANAVSLIEKYDVVIDGTDNFPTRYLVNDACVLQGKPYIYGAIYRFEGQASVFAAKEGPCYRCLFPDPPPAEAVPNCAEAGVLGVLAGMIGTLQATEAVKLILGLGASLSGRLLMYDAIEMRFDTVKIERSPNCPLCGDKPTITSVSETAVACCAASPGTSQVEELSPTELQRRLDRGEQLFLLDVRNKDEHQICRLEKANLIPLSDLSAHLGELDKDEEIVVYCKSGGRSRVAAELLQKHGFTCVRNLTGGILAWIKDIDSSLTPY